MPRLRYFMPLVVNGPPLDDEHAGALSAAAQMVRDSGAAVKQSHQMVREARQQLATIRPPLKIFLPPTR